MILFLGTFRHSIWRTSSSDVVFLPSTGFYESRAKLRGAGICWPAPLLPLSSPFPPALSSPLPSLFPLLSFSLSFCPSPLSAFPSLHSQANDFLLALPLSSAMLLERSQLVSARTLKCHKESDISKIYKWLWPRMVFSPNEHAKKVLAGGRGEGRGRS